MGSMVYLHCEDCHYRRKWTLGCGMYKPFDEDERDRLRKERLHAAVLKGRYGAKLKRWLRRYEEDKNAEVYFKFEDSKLYVCPHCHTLRAYRGFAISFNILHQLPNEDKAHTHAFVYRQPHFCSKCRKEGRKIQMIIYQELEMKLNCPKCKSLKKLHFFWVLYD